MKEIKPDCNYEIYHTNGGGFYDYPCEVPLAEVKVFIHDSLMIMNHNFPCPVCKIKHAVINGHGLIMHPCWDCQEEGYKLVKEPNNPWYRKFL